MQDTIIEKLQEAVECGKMKKDSPYPPALKGQDGASELTVNAIEAGIAPADILNKALVPAMQSVGEKYAQGQIFIPQMLLSANAMKEAMKHLKPYFQCGDIKRKGVFVIGTVAGDLHDIGKNLTAMMVEGAGWEVIDLGTDVSAAKFNAAIDEHPGAHCGMSALLTTTMSNMPAMIQEIKSKHPESKIIVGGAPLSERFAQESGADAYGREPIDDVNWLNSLV